MNHQELNPKAREAFGKSLIDIGVSIFKSLIFLLTVIPLAALLKAMLAPSPTKIVWRNIFAPFSGLSGILIMLLLGGAFLLANYLRQEGIWHLHEVEEGAESNVKVDA